jgi:hypothetical protein
MIVGLGTESGVRVMTNGDLARGERLQIMLSPEELEALDDFRFKHRMPSSAAAVRDLLRMGLASVGIDAVAGRKSGSFGVLEQETGDGKDKPGNKA